MRHGRRRLARWLAFSALVLLAAAPGGVRAAPPAAAPPAAAAVAPPASLLFPFGVRTPSATIAGPAIETGLLWLAAHQAPDGRFGPADFVSWCDGKPASGPQPDGVGYPHFGVGVTGLALLAFLGVGCDPRPGHRHADTVGRGLQWLRSVQDPEGCFGTRESDHFLYNHAYATTAMVEAYGMTGDPVLRASAQRALDFHALSRNQYFAWRYGVRAGDNDTSVTVSMATALFAARQVNATALAHGARQPFDLDEECFPGMKAWIDKMTDPEWGRVGYAERGTGPARTADLVDRFPNDKSESMTAMALYARMKMGESPAKDDVVSKGLALCLKLVPTWNPADGSIDLYYWWYGSTATFLAGGDTWQRWAAALKPALVDTQRMDGNPCGFRGSWDPLDPWASSGGRLYSTALALLALETSSRCRGPGEGRRDLLEAIADPWLDDVTRLDAAQAVAALRPKGGPAALERILHAKEPAARGAALEAIASMAPAPPELAAPVLAAAADPVPGVRAAAIRALVRFVPAPARAERVLLAALADASSEVRAAAATALASAKGDVAAASEALRRALADATPGVRLLAGCALWRLVREPHADVLFDALPLSGDVERAAAVATIGEMGSAAGPGAGARLSAMLDGTSGDLRVALVEAMWRVRPAAEAGAPLDATATATIEGAIRGEDATARLRAIRFAGLLGRHGKPWVNGLVRILLQGSSAVERAAAAAALGGIGPAALDAAGALHVARRRWQGEPEVVAACEDALAKMEVPAGAEVPGIVSTLAWGWGDRELHAAAARTLVELGPAAASALFQAVDGTQEPLSSEIAAAIGRMGEPALPAMIAASESASARVRAAAATTIAAAGAATPAAVDALLRLLRDPEPPVSEAAERALDRIGARAGPALAPRADALAEALATGVPRLRRAYARLLGWAGAAAPRALSALARALDDPDDGTGTAAGQALAAMGKDGVAPLLDALRSGSERAGTRAAAGFAALPPAVAAAAARDAVPLLLTRLGSALAQPAVVEALARVGKAAVEPLRPVLRDASAVVRCGAALALGGIGKDAQGALGALQDAAKREKDARALAAMTNALAKIQKPGG